VCGSNDGDWVCGDPKTKRLGRSLVKRCSVKVLLTYNSLKTTEYHTSPPLFVSYTCGGLIAVLLPCVRSRPFSSTCAVKLASIVIRLGKRRRRYIDLPLTSSKRSLYGELEGGGRLSYIFSFLTCVHLAS